MSLGPTLGNGKVRKLQCPFPRTSGSSFLSCFMTSGALLQLLSWISSSILLLASQLICNLGMMGEDLGRQHPRNFLGLLCWWLIVTKLSKRTFQSVIIQIGRGNEMHPSSINSHKRSHLASLSLFLSLQMCDHGASHNRVIRTLRWHFHQRC